MVKLYIKFMNLLCLKEIIYINIKSKHINKCDDIKVIKIYLSS